MDYRSKPILFLSRLGMKLRRLALVKWLSHSLWGRSYRTVITWSTLVCLIAAVSVGGVALYTKLTGGNKADQHLAELQRAVAEDDLEAAAVALEQLVQLQPDNKRYSLRLALADHQRGRTDKRKCACKSLSKSRTRKLLCGWLRTTTRTAAIKAGTTSSVLSFAACCNWPFKRQRKRFRARETSARNVLT